MDTPVLLALIGLPVQLILALATYQKSRRTDRAVNHRVTKNTISQDVQDIKAQQELMQIDIIFLRKAVHKILRNTSHDLDLD